MFVQHPVKIAVRMFKVQLFDNYSIQLICRLHFTWHHYSYDLIIGDCKCNNVSITSEVVVVGSRSWIQIARKTISLIQGFWFQHANENCLCHNCEYPSSTFLHYTVGIWNLTIWKPETFENRTIWEPTYFWPLKTWHVGFSDPHCTSLCCREIQNWI